MDPFHVLRSIRIRVHSRPFAVSRAMKVILVTIDGGKDGRVQKLLVSSLVRTFFGGEILASGARDAPLFALGRPQVREFRVEFPGGISRDGVVRAVLREQVEAETDDWVVVAEPGSIALRNLDHLFPPRYSGPYAAEREDFLWVGGRHPLQASRAVWAVRGDRLEAVLEHWEALEQAGNEPEVWARVVETLPLRKKRFETGEVVVFPDPGRVDWLACSRAALVCLPGWPGEARWELLQAMYLKLCLGDSTGMIAGILEP